MKKSSIAAVLILGLTGAIASVPASAASVLYDNTVPANTGTIAAWNIWSLASSDSFTLAQDSTVTGADFDVWVGPGDLLTSVEWSIGTSPYSASLGSATATTFSSSFVGVAEGFYDVYDESFAISPLSLNGSTTYWFTLEDAVATPGTGAFWDISQGPSAAYANSDGSTAGYGGGTGSSTFQILGTPSATVIPEPSSFLLLASGLVGLAGMVRRKLWA